MHLHTAKLVLALTAFTLALVAHAGRPAPDWMETKTRAEELYSQGSFELARREYLTVDATKLSEDDRRWLEFRLADTRWRSAAGARNADDTDLAEARKSLEDMQRKIERREQRDRVWALAEESLGDWGWLRQGGRDWSMAFPHYNAALEWWGGARDVETARERYLSIAFRMGWPDGGKGDSSWWFGQVPRTVAQNTVKIAQRPGDRAQAAYLLACVLRNQGGDYDAQARMIESLRAVVAMDRGTRFRDDAMYRLAQWIESYGEPKVADDGSWAAQPDYVEALSLYRRLQEEYKKGDSAWWDEARDGIARILRVEVNVALPSGYLPGSQVGYAISWRNAARVDLALYAVDLTRDVSFADKDKGWSSWLESIDVTKLDAAQRWSHETKDDGRHVPGQASLKLEAPLAPGAYVIEARAGDARSRDLVLVSDTSLVIKTVGSQLLAWCVDGSTSEPIAGADVRLFSRHWADNRWAWKDEHKPTAADGTAVFEMKTGSGHEFFAAVKLGERTAYAGGGSWGNDSGGGRWRIYAFTDRSTYRPDNEVNWKVIARRTDGGPWITPGGKTLDYEVFDPRGASYKKGSLKLSDFGSAFAALTPDAQAPLGEYRVDFKSAGASVGGATLFRLEEYKLPEFEVRVKPTDDDGKPRLYVVGDKVEVEIEASFYSGGAVADADVEVLVRQDNYYRRWTKPREFAWLYDTSNEGRWNHWRGSGTVVKQEKLKTDARGIARIVFDTPRDLGNDFEFTIEARVTDASRREISGSGTVRVTRREYDVDVTATRNLNRPGENTEFAFRAMDANDSPVAAEGKVRVTRERWVEVWLDPDGKEHTGAELDDLFVRDPHFPPLAPPGKLPWRRKSGEYKGEEVTSATVKLDAKGQGTFAFVPQKSGYYRVRWTSKDGHGRPVESETWTWALDESTRDIGYASQGLELVVDKDTFTVGSKAPVMITTSPSNRWVLVCVEGERLHSWQVVHVEGTAKLVPIDVTEALLPNAWITAATVRKGEVLSDGKEVVVPPVDQFLDVSVSCDHDPVLPGSKATLDVVTKDRSGKPVSVEVALGLVDESVAAIQGDYAGDIRQFFYGQRKNQLVQLHSSSDQRRCVRYVLDEKGQIVDERFAYGPTNERGERDEDGEVSDLRKVKEESSVRMRGAGAGGRMSLGRSVSKKDMAAPGAPAPASAGSDMFFGGLAANEAKASVAMDDAGAPGQKGGAGSEGGEVVVRSDFRETALWQPDLRTDANGRAQVEVKFPDSLTRWKASARVVDTATRVGTAASTVRAQKPLVARLQAPRFFTVGDETFVSVVVGNRTDVETRARAELVVEGPLDVLDPRSPELVIPPQGESRVDWKVRAARPGDVKVTVTARGAKDSDAMVRTYPVQDHGIEVQVARSLKLKDQELVASLDVPAARTRETTMFTVDVAPSMAVTMLDALPYLVEYPYGCTEQTMSRFLPAAIVANTLRARGLSPEDAMKRVFGGIEPETAGATHPKGKKSLDELDAITRQSLDRLYDFQHADGGWGWWKEGDSDPWMSAYVVWGLSLARDAKLDVRLDAIERGVQFLSVTLVQAEGQPDLAAWMLHALGASKLAETDARTAVGFAKLWEQKNALQAYGKALFALAAQSLKKTEEARTLCANLANGVQIDAHPDASKIGGAGQASHANALATAHWGSEEGWWRWQEGAVESTAFALRALCAIDPKNPLVESASNWLVQNRRGSQWSNTRDSALAILALDAFLNATGEVARDVEYELVVNGKVVATKKLTAADMLSAPAHFVIPAEDVRDGANEVRLRRVRGEGPLYLAARAVFFSREDKIAARGSSLFVKRQYFKMVARPTLLAGVVYDRVPLEDGGTVTSGERVEVVLTLESKNDFEYLMFEDLKPAGLEAAELKSGGPAYAREIKKGEIDRRFGDARALANAPDSGDWARFTGRQRFVHQELRDRKVALFLDRLPQGVWETSYELRAEVPGRFSALPTMGSAMYVPEIRCNGDEIKLTVEDRGKQGQ